MKLQLESYKKKYTIETQNDDLDIFEYLDIFKGLLISSGFEANAVDSAIVEFADTLKDNNLIDL